MALGRKRFWIAAALIGLPLIALSYAWAQRRPIAKSMIDDELAKRGVPASYDIKAVGTKLQRIEHIVIGDPKNPDLTADWAEIDTSLSLSGATVRAVRAGGVRLRGRLVDGVVKFGAVDRLLPPPTNEPFVFPNLDIALSNAVLSLATPMGGVGVSLSGRGNLAQDFTGRTAVATQSLTSGRCQLSNALASGDVKLTRSMPSFVGSVMADRAKCAGVDLASLSGPASFATDAKFTHWDGNAELKASQAWAPGVNARQLSLIANAAGTTADLSGKYQLRAGDIRARSDILATQVTFDGTFAGSTAALTGEYHARAAQVQSSQAALKGVDASGGYGATIAGPGGFDISSNGQTKAERLIPSAAMMAGVSRIGAAGSNSPIAPIARSIGDALSALGKGGSFSAAYVLSHKAGRGQITLNGIDASAVSGAQLNFAGQNPLRYDWPSGQVVLSGVVSVSGGGLPESRISLNGARGVAVIAPMNVGETRLALSPVSFRFSPRGPQVSTVATFDGPVGGGRVSGLILPLSLSPGANPFAGCMKPRFARLELAGLSLGATTIDGCLNGNEIKLNAPQFAGKIGTTPFSASASRANIIVTNQKFSVDGLKIKLAGSPEPSILTMPNLTGAVTGGGFAGHYAGVSGKLGAVPLLLSAAAGDWHYARDVFTTRAQLLVADAQAEPRFYPLSSRDFSLRFAQGSIAAGGLLIAPKSGRTVSRVTISHLLGPGTGSAALDVDGLNFDELLQPDDLTVTTKGVIANVVGSVRGKGQIDWTPSGVRSTGIFRTDGLDMAAAFGPITQLSGEIRLSDLLGLETEPGQIVKLGAVNPGIAALDGVISYQLLPGLKTQINGGRWPFAGGMLILEPTVLDLNQAAERRMTFRVEGLDMARFIAAMEFENVAATGTFDGELPMVFDKEGGRIVGGRLVARSGGSVSYVGDISNENIGAMGRFAFDALKSIKYSRLSVDLNGAIDGDVITKISFAGVNQAPITGVRAKFPIPLKVTGLTNIPFIFNVTITAKFRQLFETVRSFNDPSILINRALPQLEPVPKEKSPAVQPSESEPKP